MTERAYGQNPRRLSPEERDAVRETQSAFRAGDVERLTELFQHASVATTDQVLRDVENHSEENLRIKNASKALRVETLATFPLKPTRYEISLVDSGADPHDAIDLKKVGNRRVMPGTTLQWAYSRDVNMLVPDSTQYHFFHPYTERDDDYQKMMEEVVSRVVKGGRFAEHKFESWGEGYQDFKGRLLKHIARDYYEVSRAEIWATTQKTGSHYSEGYDMGSGLWIGRGKEGYDIKLALPSSYRMYLDKSEVPQLMTWFAGLRNKSQNPQ